MSSSPWHSCKSLQYGGMELIKICLLLLFYFFKYTPGLQTKRTKTVFLIVNIIMVLVNIHQRENSPPMSRKLCRSWPRWTASITS